VDIVPPLAPDAAARVKPKILFLIGSMGVGGAERFLKELVIRVPRGEFDVTLVCLWERGLWGRELEERAFRVLCLEKKLGLDFRLLPRLVGLMSRERPDIVNTHLWTADLWGRLAALLARVPWVVVTEQNVDVWKRWYHRLLDRLLFLGTDLVICVSEEVRAYYERELGVPARKIRVIPNAIDLGPFAAPPPEGRLREEVGAEPGEFLFVCAARLHPQKGHPVLFEAVARLVEEGRRGFKVLLAGDGSLRGDLEAKVASLGLASRVRFLGLRHDMPSVLLQADAFVLPSLYEGLPLAVLEAMAARLPVVATRVGGNSEAVEDGKTGLLVPPADAPALAEAMARLLGDRAAARAMGEAGRLRVEARYDIERITGLTLALFRQGLRPTRRSGG
jgi:glycosyltransferase involved in cell wall biosynthesis